MTLIQKLPLGLALAACMMMSSCSQEDVQVAKPEQTNLSSNSKVAAGPYIAPTAGWAGDHVFAPGWNKCIESSPDNKQVNSAGTSTITSLWGNLFQPWIKALPLPGANAGNNQGNFVTFVVQRNVLDNSPAGTASKVETKITNLQPGKKYAVTLKLASTIKMRNGKQTQYAKTVNVDIAGTVNPDLGNGITTTDLTGKEAEWVTRTITFVAPDTELTMYVRATVSQAYNDTHDKFLMYAHVYVPQNAIVEVP